MHPELGERILEPIDRLAEVRTIVRSCHERWDGEGYPDGTSGEDIPVRGQDRARLRCLPRDDDRQALPQAPGQDEAFSSLCVEGAGTQFDPAVVEVFLSLPCEAPVPVERVDAERLAS